MNVKIANESKSPIMDCISLLFDLIYFSPNLIYLYDFELSVWYINWYIICTPNGFWGFGKGGTMIGRDWE